MTIYILRHAERNSQNPLFESSLTPIGYTNASLLSDYIYTLNINTIYSSPFYRTIQTIYPYCITYNKSINIENSLYESMDSLLFTRYNSTYTWCDLPPKYHNIINKKYKSTYGDVKLFESFSDVCKRVIPFIEKIKDSDKNILLVSHKTTCNAVRHYFNSNIKYDSILDFGEIVQIE